MEPLMTSEEVAALLHVDPVTIRRLVSKGQLSAYRVGADYRFSPADLQDYLKRQRLPALESHPSTARSGHPFDRLGHLMQNILQPKNTTPGQLFTRSDRCTKRARQVLLLAQEEARRLKHPFLGTEHLLLGILAEGEGLAAKTLINLGADLEALRGIIAGTVGTGGAPDPAEVSFTPRTKKVLELSVEEARRLNHSFIGTEHLLLGLLLEGEGVAINALKQVGIQPERVREEVHFLLSLKLPGVSPDGSAGPGSPPSEELLTLPCPECGTGCPPSYRYCFNCGELLIPESPEKLPGKEEK